MRVNESFLGIIRVSALLYTKKNSENSAANKDWRPT